MEPTKQQYKAAVVQAEPVWLDVDATIDKAIGLIGQASAGGADLVAFPETWVPGYPWWIWLGAPAWGMQFVQRYFENSVVIGEEPLARVQAAAAEHGIHVSLGISERDGGSLYMGQVLIDDAGEIVHARRKLKPTHVERSVFGEGAGGRPRGARHGDRQGRLAVLLGAPAATDAVRDVQQGRAGALRGVADVLPLRRHGLRARPGGQHGREPHVRRRGRLLRARRVRDGRRQRPRAVLRHARQGPDARPRRRARDDLRARRPRARRAAATPPRRACCSPTSTWG